MSKFEFNNGNDVYETGKYIPIYQNYIREGHPQQLSPRELYTYIVLKNHTTLFNNNITIITLNLLAYLLPFLKCKEMKMNVRELRQILYNLKVKSVIDYSEPRNNNEPVRIVLEEIKHEDTKDTQFLLVPEFIISKTDVPDELYVLIVIYNIARFDDKQGDNNPYYRNKRNWHGLLGVKSPTTAEKVINNMIGKQLIFYYENDCEYDEANEKFVQEAGKYYLAPQEKEEQRVMEMRKREEENRRKRLQYEKMNSEDTDMKEDWGDIEFNFKDDDKVAHLFFNINKESEEDKGEFEIINGRKIKTRENIFTYEKEYYFAGDWLLKQELIDTYFTNGDFV